MNVFWTKSRRLLFGTPVNDMVPSQNETDPVIVKCQLIAVIGRKLDGGFVQPIP